MQHVISAVHEEYSVAAADVEGERVVYLEALAAVVFGEASAREYRGRADDKALGLRVNGCDRVRPPGLGDEVEGACGWITLEFVGLITAVRGRAHRIWDRGLAAGPTTDGSHCVVCHREEHCKEQKWTSFAVFVLIHWC